MGQPVVHFEVMGNDVDRLRSFYSTMFDWKIDADNPQNYGLIDRERNVNGDGIGIGGGIGGIPEGRPGHVTFYVEVPDVEAALVKAEGLGAARLMGPMEVNDEVEIGVFNDPEGHTIGLIRSQS
jgi:uncharacterized protein